MSAGRAVDPAFAALANMATRTAGYARVNGSGPEAPVDPPDPAVVERLMAELDVDQATAERLAMEVAAKVRSRRLDGVARRIVTEEDAERDQRLELVVAITADVFLAQGSDHPVRPLLGNLVAEGHNATLTAAFKVGKTTVVENAIAALVTGEPFLGRFSVPEPKRVTLLNHELTDDDQRQRIDALGLELEARRRLSVVNLRGKRLAITTPSGRDHLVRLLTEHGSEVVVCDPWGVSMSHAGLDENKPTEARIWTTAFDEIKDMARCSSGIVPLHTGRAEQTSGAERARGATTMDDWSDVRLVLTRTIEGDRYLRSDGRATDLPESRLGFDPFNRRLTLDLDALGVGRGQAEALKIIAGVEAVVATEPGMTLRSILKALAEDGIGKDTVEAAVKLAKRRGRIHHHAGPRGAHLHYLGALHHDDDPCPGGAQ